MNNNFYDTEVEWIDCYEFQRLVDKERSRIHQDPDAYDYLLELIMDDPSSRLAIRQVLVYGTASAFSDLVEKYADEYARKVVEDGFH